MPVFLWIFASGLLMSALALVGSATLLLTETTNFYAIRLAEILQKRMFMQIKITAFLLTLVFVSVTAFPFAAAAQNKGAGCCGHGGSGGRGMRGDPSHRTDRADFHFLLAHREQIRRTMNLLPNGVDTVTESDDPTIVATLQKHVRAMHRRLQEHRPIHRRDPFFAEVFAHGDQIEMQITNTEHGVQVRETSDDPYVVRLIQAHAEVVNRFLAHGMAEMHRNHPLPPRP